MLRITCERSCLDVTTQLLNLMCVCVWHVCVCVWRVCVCVCACVVHKGIVWAVRGVEPAQCVCVACVCGARVCVCVCVCGARVCVCVCGARGDSLGREGHQSADSREGGWRPASPPTRNAGPSSELSEEGALPTPSTKLGFSFPLGFI